MLRPLSILLLSVFFMAVSSMTVADNVEEKFLLDVTVEEAAELIADNPDIVILDVRTPREFKRSHIENAINIDYHSFSFKSKIRKLDRDKTYLIHCQSGVRSGKTIPLLRIEGFNKVYHMGAGMRAWQEAGLPSI